MVRIFRNEGHTGNYIWLYNKTRAFRRDYIRKKIEMYNFYTFGNTWMKLIMVSDGTKLSGAYINCDYLSNFGLVLSS